MIVPSWSGHGHDFDAYKEEVMLYYAACESSDRAHVAPRLIQRLTGAPRQAALRRLPDLSCDGGHILLLDLLESVVGRTPHSALAAQLEGLFSRTKRGHNETMSSWFLRFTREHELLQRTLQRVRLQSQSPRRASWTSYLGSGGLGSAPAPAAPHGTGRPSGAAAASG